VSFGVRAANRGSKWAWRSGSRHDNILIITVANHGSGVVQAQGLHTIPAVWVPGEGERLRVAHKSARLLSARATCPCAAASGSPAQWGGIQVQSRSGLRSGAWAWGRSLSLIFRRRLGPGLRACRPVRVTTDARAPRADGPEGRGPRSGAWGSRAEGRCGLRVQVCCWV
jgi:hypothetical protein